MACHLLQRVIKFRLSSLWPQVLQNIDRHPVYHMGELGLSNKKRLECTISHQETSLAFMKLQIDKTKSSHWLSNARKLLPYLTSSPKHISKKHIHRAGEGAGGKKKGGMEGGRVLDLLENRFLQKSFRLTEKEGYTKIPHTSHCPSTHPASTIYGHFIIAKHLGPNYNVSLRGGGSCVVLTSQHTFMC